MLNTSTNTLLPSVKSNTALKLSTLKSHLGKYIFGKNELNGDKNSILIFQIYFFSILRNDI